MLTIKKSLLVAGSLLALVAAGFLGIWIYREIAAQQQYPTPTNAVDFNTCINHHNGFSDYPEGVVGGHHLHSGLELENPDGALLLGRIGWHLTWAAILDMRGDVPVVFDTFGSEDNGMWVLFREPLPNGMIASFQACGAEYAGAVSVPFEQWPDMFGEWIVDGRVDLAAGLLINQDWFEDDFMPPE